MTEKLHGNVERYVDSRKSLTIEQIAEAKPGETCPRNILIEGDPGVGKTTLAWELCRGWGEGKLLKQWDVVTLVQLRDRYIRQANSFQELLDPHEQFGSELYHYMKSICGRGLMMIFDGYDEITPSQMEYDSVLHRLLVGGVLPEATMVVTSRPSATHTLPQEFRCHLDDRIELVGFSDREMIEYINCKFADNAELLNDFQSYISSHPFVYKAMYIPLHCALVTDLYQTYWRKGKTAFAPKTITQLYTCFILSLLERYLDDHPVYGPQELSIQQLSDLPQDVYKDLMKLAELAAEGIEEHYYIFDNLTHDTLGLMQRVVDGESRKTKSVSFSFLHLSLQEYLAAFYWSKPDTPPETIALLFSDTGILPVAKYINEGETSASSIHWPALYFYGGLTKIVGTQLENILFSVQSVNCNLLRLLFESQNMNYIASLLKENLYFITIGTYLEAFVTGYCISHSSPTARYRIDDLYDHFLQAMTVTCTTYGGKIVSFSNIRVANYSKSLQSLFQLRQFTTELTFLRLSQCICNSENVTVCCNELSQLHIYCPKLQKLMLLADGNKLNCTPLFDSLQHMSSLEELHLQGVIIDDSNYTVTNGLQQTTTLKSLVIRISNLIHSSAKVLLQNESLQSLTLSHINNDSKVTTTLTTRQQSYISCLNNNTCTLSISTVRLLTKGLEQNELPIQLWTNTDINMNMMISEVIEIKSLTSLELFYINMDIELAVALRDVLKGNTTLKTLAIGNCIYSHPNVLQIVSIGLQQNRGLEILKLSENTSAMVKQVLQEVETSQTMSSVTLCRNAMGIDEYRVLSNVLKVNQTLKYLTIHDETINILKVQHLTEGLRLNTQLAEIRICDYTSPHFLPGLHAAKLLGDAVINNTTKLVLSDKYQQHLSVYSYPVDRVLYRSIYECK